MSGLHEGAVVAIPTSGFEGTAICCAYVPSPGIDITPAMLRRELSQRLPGYMLPARWLAFEQFPKNANGKIDRPRLREVFETPCSSSRLSLPNSTGSSRAGWRRRRTTSGSTSATAASSSARSGSRSPCSAARRCCGCSPRTTTDKPIGVVGLANINPHFKTGNLWVVLGEKAYAGHGYASRAVSQMLTLGFAELGLYAINTWIVEHNPSVRVAERVHFRPMGRQRQCHYIDGRAYDRLWFDLLASEHEEIR